MHTLNLMFVTSGSHKQIDCAEALSNEDVLKKALHKNKLLMVKHRSSAELEWETVFPESSKNVVTVAKFISCSIFYDTCTKIVYPHDLYTYSIETINGKETTYTTVSGPEAPEMIENLIESAEEQGAKVSFRGVVVVDNNKEE